MTWKPVKSYMKDETKTWLRYAGENLESAKILLQSELYNPCLQNVQQSVEIKITDDDCDFLNSIYLPSKYPVGSVLADYEPDEKICQKAIAIAEKALDSVAEYFF